MNKTLKAQFQRFLQTEKEISSLDYILNALSLDQYTLMPEAAFEARSQQLELIASLIHQKLTSTTYKKLTASLYRNRDKFTGMKLSMIDTRRREVIDSGKIPKEHVEKWAKIASSGYQSWLKAREENNFDIFAPQLKTIVGLWKKEAKYLNKDPYETALYHHGEFIEVEALKAILSQLKEGLQDILDRLPPQPAPSIAKRSLIIPVETQKEVASHILDLIGIDKSRFAIAETVHPFQITLSLNDNRIATCYYPNDWTCGAGSILHEGGHCLYEQGMDPKLYGTCLQSAPTMGLHESQSRFYETCIGLSYDFWKFYYPMLQAWAPQLLDISLEEYYANLIRVERGRVRLEADELTYCLHIIVRFELEIELLEGGLKVEDLPEAWNQKYRDYLGVEPSSDLKEGVLQDSHWSDGGFGYFPSYAIGNMLAAMFRHKLKEENVLEMSEGGFLRIRDWLKDKMHRHGSIYDEETLIKKIFKEPLTPKYYLEYLNEKYTP